MVKIIDFSKKNMKLLFVLMFLILLLYLHFVGLLAKVEFWNIPITLFVAITLWYLNERSKRIEQQYKFKLEIYGGMLETLSSFYKQGDPNLKAEFLNQYRKLWIVADDDVIISANDFFIAMENVNSTQEEQQTALSKFVTCLRKDLISNRGVIIKDTNLGYDDFKHVI